MRLPIEPQIRTQKCKREVRLHSYNKMRLSARTFRRK